MFPYAVGNFFIVRFYPRAIVIRGGIPDIAFVQIIDVTGKEQIIPHPDSYVKTKPWRI